MGVSLSKGGNVSLTKAAPGLKAVSVGLGWDVRSTTGTDFDLDASALGLAENHKIVSDEYFVFFNNTSSPEGAIVHQGDNLTGEGEGDDEVINVDLTTVPADGRLDRLPGLDLRRGRPRAVLRAGPQRVHPGGRPGQRHRARPLRPVRGRVDRDRDGVRRAVPQRCRNGSSAPSARAMRPGSRASPATSASII